MKRFIGILFLIILLAPALVTYSWLRLEKLALKKEIKWRMIEGIADDKLVQLSFTTQEAEQKLRWEHAKEFEFENEMYDVVKTITRGDSVFYICWWDNKETQLNRQLSGLVADAFGNNPEQKDKQNKLINFYKILFFKPIASPIFIVEQHPTANFKCVSNFYQSAFLQVATPPPSFC